jgi:hypothetical protein
LTTGARARRTGSGARAETSERAFMALFRIVRFIRLMWLDSMISLNFPA